MHRTHTLMHPHPCLFTSQTMHPHICTRPHAPTPLYTPSCAHTPVYTRLLYPRPCTHPHAPMTLFVHIPHSYCTPPSCTHSSAHTHMHPCPCTHPHAPMTLYTPLTLTGDDPLEGHEGAGPPGSVPAPGGPHPQQRERVGRQVLPGRTVRTPKPVVHWVLHMRTCACRTHGSKTGSVYSERPITHGHTPCLHPSPFAVVSTAALS
jgi:hypothetical protein